MRADGLYRIVGGIVLVVFSVAVPLVKLQGSGGILAILSTDELLIIGCLAIALLGVLVAAAGMRSLKKIRMMTALVGGMVREKSRIVTKEISDTVGLHETEVRERIDEMIKRREIPAGTRVMYIGGEKVVT